MTIFPGLFFGGLENPSRANTPLKCPAVSSRMKLTLPMGLFRGLFSTKGYTELTMNIQGALGFIVLASATLPVEVRMVLISAVLNLVAIVLNWIFYWLYRRVSIIWQTKLDSRYLMGSAIMTLVAGTSSVIALRYSDPC